MEIANIDQVTPDSIIYRYGREVNTHDVMKIIVVLFMLVDHFYFFVLRQDSFFRFFSHGSPPLLFFLIGYTGKLRIRLSLIIYGAVLSYIFTITMADAFYLDILVVFMATYLILRLFPLDGTHPILFVGLVAILVASNGVLYPHVEYGTLGILIALAARWATKTRKPLAWLSLALALGYYLFWQHTVFPHMFTTNLRAAVAYALMGMVLWTAFYFYKQVNLTYWPSWLKKPALFMSRYSLGIYFWHLFILQIYFWHRVLPQLLFGNN